MRAHAASLVISIVVSLMILKVWNFDELGRSAQVVLTLPESNGGGVLGFLLELEVFGCLLVVLSGLEVVMLANAAHFLERIGAVVAVLLAFWVHCIIWKS